MSKHPKSIVIISEGFEEKPYIDKIVKFPSIKKEKYLFCKSVNVKGNGGIISKYQELYNSTKFDLILIFCDADKGSDQFKQIKQKLGELMFGDNPSVVDEIFIFVNPVTLQVVLSHFGKVSLTHKSKKINAPIVKQLTGIEDYDAKDEQIKELISKISFTNYKIMKENIKSLPTDIALLPSTNFLLFLNRFESDDDSWIDEINKKLSA